MARITVEEQKDFPTLPADSILHLLVSECDVKTVKSDRGDWDKLEFKFKVLGIQSTPGHNPADFESLIGQHIWGSTPFRLTDSQENKLRQWGEAILRRQLPLGFDLDTDFFLRQEVRGVTSVWEKKTINQATGKPYTSHQIASLLPIGEIQQAGPPGGALPQQPQAGWGAPGVPQQAPTGWGQPQPPAHGDPWATPTQQPQQPAAQPAPQQPQAPQPAADPWATPGGTYDEPPF